jgi:hypothetical protein
VPQKMPPSLPAIATNREPPFPVRLQTHNCDRSGFSFPCSFRAPPRDPHNRLLPFHSGVQISRDCDILRRRRCGAGYSIL